MSMMPIWIPRCARRPFRARLAVAALGALSLAALTDCAGAPPQRTAAKARGESGKTAAAPPSSPAAPAAAPPAQPSAVLKTPGQPQPPDGKWLQDEEGRLYFLEQIAKDFAQRMPDGTVRARWGTPITVVKEDDKNYYYKVYKVPDTAVTAAAQPKEPTKEDLAKVAATYRVDLKESDRLRFVPFGNGLPTAGQWRDGFDIADMNGDGQLDIVHCPPRKGFSNPVIFLGDGKGTWQRWRGMKYPEIAFDYGDAVVADFNGDGHPDIALGMHLRGIQVLLGDGKGGFTNWSAGLDFSVPGSKGDEGGFSSKALAVADWNGDGRPDLLAFGEGPRLSSTGGRAAGVVPTSSYGVVIYLNQGDGTWVRKDQGTGAAAHVFGDSLTLGDFNADRHLDFATSSSVQGRKDLLNLGRADGGWDPMELAEVRPGSYINAVHGADFDGDGRTDLAVSYLSYELGVWRTGIDLFYSRPGDRWERRALAVEEGRAGVFGLGSGDLDGDGHRDLVALTGDGRTWIFLGDGKGSFTREKTGVPVFPGGCRGYRVRLKDLDGDGRDEIVAAFAGEGSPLAGDASCPSGGGLTAWHLAPRGQK
jgi:VCBS repeat protein